MKVGSILQYFVIIGLEYHLLVFLRLQTASRNEFYSRITAGIYTELQKKPDTFYLLQTRK